MCICIRDIYRLAVYMRHINEREKFSKLQRTILNMTCYVRKIGI